MTEHWWSALLRWPLLLLGAAAIIAGLVAGNSRASVIGCTAVVLAAFCLWLRRWEHRFYARITAMNAERAPVDTAFASMSARDARRLIEELIAERSIIAIPARSREARGIPEGIPISVAEFYSLFERLESPQGDVVVGGEGISAIAKQPGHWIVDRFDDWSAGARVGDARVYAGAEFVEFRADDSHPSMWHYALSVLADVDALVAAGRIGMGADREPSP